METTKKKTTRKRAVSARARIKPRGLAGIYAGKMKLNGTSEEIFNLGL